MGQKRVPIEPTALAQYIQIFKPGIPQKAVEKRLEIAAGKPVGQEISIAGTDMIYAPIQTGNHHVCLAGYSDGIVVDITTKQKFREKYGTR